MQKKRESMKKVKDLGPEKMMSENQTGLLDNFNADNELVGLLVFIFYFVTFILCE